MDFSDCSSSSEEQPKVYERRHVMYMDLEPNTPPYYADDIVGNSSNDATSFSQRLVSNDEPLPAQPLHNRFCKGTAQDVARLRLQASIVLPRDPEALERAFKLIIYRYERSAYGTGTWGYWELLSPLHHAVALSHVKCTKALLDFGANAFALSKYDVNAIYYAVCHGQNNSSEVKTIVQELLKRGVSPNVHSVKRKWYPSELLNYCINRQDMELLKLFLENGVQQEWMTKNESGECCLLPKIDTPLMLSVKRQQIEIFKVLLQFGAQLASSPLAYYQNNILFCIINALSTPALAQKFLILYKLFGGNLWLRLENKGPHGTITPARDFQLRYHVLLPHMRKLMTQGPLGLQNLCRVAIREHMGMRYWQSIEHLPIPLDLKSFLKFDDLVCDDIVVSIFDYTPSGLQV